MDEESSEELEQEKEMNEEYDDSNLPESPFIHTKKKVKAIGNEVPPPFETFEELHKKLQTNLTFDPFSNQTSNNKKKPKKKNNRNLLKTYLLNNIESLGFKSPSPIQKHAIPVLLNKRELLATAPTGSGKTAAFAIPILAALKVTFKTIPIIIAF